MWTRAELKDRCKSVMKQNYWIMFLVCLAGNILTGHIPEVIHINYNLVDILPYHDLFQITGFYPGYYETMSFFLSVFFLVFAAGILVSIVYQTFVGGPIICGMARFFCKNTESNQSFSELFSIFSTHYLNVCKIMFLVNIKVIAWSLLLIIPGIVKNYEYSMIPYILAENPEISAKEAFRISKEMTCGEKMNLFILDLSFIGWNLLGNLLIIGNLFVAPYKAGTWAEAYLALKQNRSGSEFL